MAGQTWRVLRPLALLLFILVEVFVAEGIGLSIAVALAATAAAGAALVACALILSRSVPRVPPTRIRTALRDREQRTALLTLYPGDAVSTGTPAGAALGRPDPKPYLRAGDVVELEIEGLGRRRQVLKGA
ncbi:fumarylacetoacetate hydrolase family protein [Streptomyces pacificus]|uniref:Fumarylacetoacetase-like C-terminal domain-containing protein n=1 Tax=Streptomyces pacificus TaxID=2705029 RepID=A0A6A0AMB2_9ACTN|nr:fumarylacetoacetate hydrolase family protein [Streptomyces pacificus]GFH33922.1 hypothetical protein SCWH03_01230 [Streptomyces pacificus]